VLTHHDLELDASKAKVCLELQAKWRAVALTIERGKLEQVYHVFLWSHNQIKRIHTLELHKGTLQVVLHSNVAPGGSRVASQPEKFFEFPRVINKIL
jgi:hypothetical protein